jgi:hypothetical protein
MRIQATCTLHTREGTEEGLPSTPSSSPSTSENPPVLARSIRTFFLYSKKRYVLSFKEESKFLKKISIRLLFKIRIFTRQLRKDREPCSTSENLPVLTMNRIESISYIFIIRYIDWYYWFIIVKLNPIFLTSGFNSRIQVFKY